jgi:hypothetical protein
VFALGSIIIADTANLKINQNVDCFGEAIESLESFEANVFELSDSQATEWINDAYASCVCVNSPSGCAEYF